MSRAPIECDHSFSVGGFSPSLASVCSLLRYETVSYAGTFILLLRTVYRRDLDLDCATKIWSRCGFGIPSPVSFLLCACPCSKPERTWNQERRNGGWCVVLAILLFHQSVIGPVQTSAPTLADRADQSPKKVPCGSDGHCQSPSFFSISIHQRALSQFRAWIKDYAVEDSGKHDARVRVCVCLCECQPLDALLGRWSCQPRNLEPLAARVALRRS